MTIRITLRDKGAGELHSHVVSDYGNYATLCGLSDDDDQFDVVPELSGASPMGGIDCRHCYEMWRTCKALRARDFARVQGGAG